VSGGGGAAPGGGDPAEAGGAGGADVPGRAGASVSSGEARHSRLSSPADAFKAFESDGWSSRAATYGALMARATAFAIEPLLDAAEVGPGVRVLDVGCGPGALSAAAAARGATVTGVDLAEGMLAHARATHPDIEFRHADAEDLPFTDGRFDVALGAFIVNHLPHPERAAGELARVARRVALAMWGPQDQVALFGLPTRAAEGLPITAPPGPDEQRFADAQALADLIGGTVHELRPTLHVDSLDALWDGVCGGTVRTAARFGGATPEQQRAAKARLGALAEPYREAGGYALPITIRIAASPRGR
jgi:SAM-dependent methyltransferase